MTAEDRWRATHRHVYMLTPEQTADELGITPGEVVERVEIMVSKGWLTPIGDGLFERTEEPPWL